jgi:hypothetical protein
MFTEHIVLREQGAIGSDKTKPIAQANQPEDEQLRAADDFVQLLALLGPKVHGNQTIGEGS